MQKLLLVPLAAAALAAAGCNGSAEPRICTQIGCNDGLQVELRGSLPDSYTVSASASGLPTQTVECSPGRECGETLFFPEFMPASVTITVRGSGVDVQQSFTPTYETSRPNGPDCPPECRSGKVIVEVG